MEILITGATGFIGKNLVEALVKEGSHQLYALVRKASKSDFLKKQGVNLIYADITSAESLKEVRQYKIDAVFHCAGYIEDNNREKLYQVNVLGTENICRLALELNVERLVYLSSVAVVSGNSQVPLTEDLAFSATNIYGLSKIEAEKKVLEFRKKGLNAAILRPCMVYGEEEPHLLGLILFLLKYRLLPIVNAGKNKLHLVYVKNVVNALILALHKNEFLKGAFFVADEEVLTVKEIFSIFSQAIYARPPFVLSMWLVPLIERIPFAGGELKFFLKDRVYDISRIKSCGYKGEFKAEDSLIRTAQYWLNNR